MSKEHREPSVKEPTAKAKGIHTANDLLRVLAYVLILAFLFGAWIALAMLPKEYQWHIAAVSIAGGAGSFCLIHWFTDWRHGR